MTAEEWGAPVCARIEVERRGGVAVVALNRPEVRNAVDDALRAELVSVIDWASREDTVRALVLTGRGTAFSAGGDIAAMRARLEAPAGQVALNGWHRQRRTHRAVTSLHELAKPTVAAVNGAAAGLGCDLALCCDFIVASERASFAMSYLLRGLIPDGGGLYFLPRRVGLARAKELIFTGRRVSAEEARAIGMVDAVSAPERLLDDAVAWAERAAAGAPGALGLAKSILDKSFELSLEQVFDLGCQAQAICYTSDDHRAAVEAFLSKERR